MQTNALIPPLQIDDNSTGNAYYAYLLSPGRYWSTDMELKCFTGYHLYLILFLGAPGRGGRYWSTR